jgi:exopolysaccharide biosynthesis protein
VRTLFRLVLGISLLFSLFIMLSHGVFSYRKALLFVAGGSRGAHFWEKWAPGVEYRDIAVGRSTDGEQHLKMVRFAPDRIKVSILYAKTYGERSMTVKEMVEHSGAFAGINASYFDEYDRPLGYLKVKGREINDYIATAIVYSGLVAIKNGKVVIEHRDTFHPLHYDEALQVGPRLVAAGTGTTGIQNTIDYKKRARRAGIAIDENGSPVVYITSPISADMNWNELREVLLGAEDRGGIKPRDVLNLDGGGSTQLYIKTGKLNVSEGYSKVPVAIGFFTR